MTYFGPKLMPLEISRCNVPGVRVMRGMGERNAIGTTTEGEDLWLGNDLSNTPAALASTTFIPSPADAGEQMSVISEHANDASGNTGVQTLTVSYIDAAGAEQTTIVTMNGTTAVPLTPTDVRFVQEMGALTVGSNTVAEGNIRIYKTSDATLVYNMIAIGGEPKLGAAQDGARRQNPSHHALERFRGQGVSVCSYDYERIVQRSGPQSASKTSSYLKTRSAVTSPRMTMMCMLLCRSSALLRFPPSPLPPSGRHRVVGGVTSWIIEAAAQHSWYPRFQHTNPPPLTGRRGSRPSPPHLTS